MENISDAEKILIEKCANGWMTTVFIEEGDGRFEKVLFECPDMDHDGQIPVLADLLGFVSKRIGPYPASIGVPIPEKEIEVNVVDIEIFASGTKKAKKKVETKKA